MKQRYRTGKLTFGDLIAGLYGACDQRRAAALIRFAVNAGLLSLPRACARWRKQSDASAATRLVPVAVSPAPALAPGAGDRAIIE